MPIAEFRRECREFADEWIDKQREEFKRLGIVADWARPYTTMAYAAEAQIGTIVTLYREDRPMSDADISTLRLLASAIVTGPLTTDQAGVPVAVPASVNAVVAVVPHLA